MAIHKIALNTTPREVQIGDDLVFLFQPEVMGDEMTDAYSAVLDASRSASDPPTPDDIKIQRKAARAFLAEFMLDESANRFAAVQLPERVIAEMIEWVIGEYGARPTGRQGGSSPQPPAKPQRSTGSSRSRA